ncbi:MAG: hypothetical protein VX589_11155 [Myxococcota bacterium]|nr:hypothetical protein [Myxococcota bacterium]
MIVKVVCGTWVRGRRLGLSDGFWHSGTKYLQQTDHHMVGDEFVPNPIVSVIHETTLPASPADVWPWIVQVGSGRAGWYSWDWIDNLGRKSATRILPEYQHLACGDIVPGYPGATHMFVVRAVEPSRHLVLGVPSKTSSDVATWSLSLEDRNHGVSILRACLRMGPVRLAGLPLPSWLIAWPLRLGHHIMQTKQFSELKKRCR